MLVVIGILLIALSALATLWAAYTFRRPDPPDWSKREGPGASVALAIMLLGGSGLGTLLKFGVEYETQPLSMSHGIAIVAIALASAATARILRSRAHRRRASSSATADATAERFTPANDTGPRSDETNTPRGRPKAA